MLGQIESLRCGDGFVVVCGWAAGDDLVGPPSGLFACVKRGARVAVERFTPREDLEQIGVQRPCAFRVHLSVPRDYEFRKEDFWLVADRTKLVPNEHTAVTLSESYGGLDRLDAKGLHGWKYPLLPGDQAPLRLRIDNKAPVEIRDFEIIDRTDVSTTVLPEKAPAAVGFLVSAETLRGALALAPGLNTGFSSIELYNDARQICASLSAAPDDAEHERSPSAATDRSSVPTILEEVFDREWYLARYPDVAAAGVDAFRHYCEAGMLEGRDPHPLFSVEHYMNSPLAGGIQRGEAFRHFLEKGHEEGVDPHPCFSMSWYQSEYENRDSRNPWLDYVKDFGWRKGREPNWLFCSAYLSQVIDLSTHDIRSPLAVFLQHESEGISPHPFFKSQFVVRHFGLNSSRAYTEYMSKSRDRWLRPSLLFDGDYAAKQAGLRCAGPSTLRDYIQCWEDRGIKPNEYFDPHWYKSISRCDRTYRTAFQHYLVEGERRSLSPCPGFNPRHYWEYNPDVARAGVSPLEHFIAAGEREKRRTHRVFDQDWYCSQHPLAADAPLRHYIRIGRPSGYSPHPFVRVMERGDGVAASDVLFGLNRPSGAASLEFLLRQSGRADIGGLLSFEATALDISKAQDEVAKCPENICRFYSSFDYGSADELYAELSADLAHRRLKDGAELATVILPTRNRASVLRRAIDSVLTQTYSHIELIIVDDGSLDGTECLVADYYTDPRIRYVRVPAAGVSAARNRGLMEARGAFVAYLDSDNYWEPTHLEVCIAAMEREGSGAAYSALRIVSEGSIVGYRGEFYDANALRRENYIDMNVYVHRRCVECAVEFDASLKRCVDWDFILRMSAIGAPTYVPVIGCNYVDDQEALQRITTHELPGDFFRVCLRESHLKEHLVGCSDGRAEVSVVWPIGPGATAADLRGLWEAAWSAQERSFEIIVVNNALPAAISRRLNELALRIQNFRVINLWRSFYEFPALNLAAHHASGEYLMLWRTDIQFDPNAIEKLVHTIRTTTGCSTVAPLVSRGDRFESVYEWGLSTSLLHPIVGEDLLAGVNDLVYNAFPISGPFLINAAVFRAAGGINFDYAQHYGFVDYALRSIAVTSGSVVTHLGIRLVGQGNRGCERSAKEFEALIGKWIGVVPTRSTLPNSLVRRTRRTREHAVQSSRAQVSRSNISIVARRPTRNKRVAIRTPAPNGKEAQWWGDFHFANSMARALARFNCDVHVVCKEDWGGIGEDVTIHLRGAHPTYLNPASRNVVWIISHPDRIPPEEMAAADVLFVGSETLRLDIRRRYGLGSEVLLQATDEFRFWPRRAPLLDEVRSKALFVGNSRMQLRPIIADALEAEVPLAIYGREWEPFAPRNVVVGNYIPNEDLALWYQSALVVLNDHWPAMRHAGILSNRLFDVVASGGVVITDKIEGVDAVFGDHVRCYSDRDELSDLIQNLNDWAPSRQRRLEQSAYLRRHHSFTERMRALWEVVQ